MLIFHHLFSAAKSNRPIGESVVFTSFTYANSAHQKFPFSTAIAKSAGKKPRHICWLVSTSPSAHFISSNNRKTTKTTQCSHQRTFVRAAPTRRVLTTWTRTDSSRYNRFTISWAHKLNDSTHCSFWLLPRARVRQSANLAVSRCRMYVISCHVLV